MLLLSRLQRPLWPIPTVGVLLYIRKKDREAIPICMEAGAEIPSDNPRKIRAKKKIFSLLKILRSKRTRYSLVSCKADYLAYSRR